MSKSPKSREKTSSIIDHKVYEDVVSEILMIHEIDNTDPERLILIRELIFNTISLYQHKLLTDERPQEIQ